MFDLNDLRFFLSVAQSGSLSGAASRLGVTHTTVSRRIVALEQSLNARLVERTANGYSLTAAGKDILAAAEAVDQQAWSIENMVSGDEERVSGVVRLTVSSGLGNCWLADKTAEFRREYPKIELEILINTEIMDLLRREADVALRVGLPGSDELVGQKLGQVSCGLFAAQSYIDAHGEPRCLKDVAHHRVVESIGGIADLAQSREFRRFLNPANVALSANSLMSLLSAARLGLGIVALPSYMIGNEHTLCRLLPDEFDVRLDLWLLTHPDLRYTARIRVVRDFLIDRVRADKSLLLGNEAAQSTSTPEKNAAQ